MCKTGPKNLKSTINFPLNVGYPIVPNCFTRLYGRNEIRDTWFFSFPAICFTWIDILVIFLESLENYTKSTQISFHNETCWIKIGSKLRKFQVFEVELKIVIPNMKIIEIAWYSNIQSAIKNWYLNRLSWNFGKRSFTLWESSEKCKTSKILTWKIEVFFRLPTTVRHSCFRIMWLLREFGGPMPESHHNLG